VGRGGGTLQDRAATWPSDLLRPLKETLQGEMVERSLATPEILRGNVLKLAAIQAQPPSYVPPGEWIQRLGAESQRAFAEVVGSPELRTLLAAATPYDHLGVLTIGSRPVRRKKKQASAGLESLRAIPWVLCWTQTRYLLHAWLGVGSAWRKLRQEKGAEATLRRELRRDPLLRSYLRLLGFTLAKTAPRLWEEYVRTLGPEAAPGLVKRLAREREDALDLASRVSKAGTLLPDRPWLLESIYYRSPMIHPLNLLQLEVLGRARGAKFKKADELLFRETVTGVAAGMLTTG
jgi:phosphoenolpyruvate carboxylase